MHRSQGSKGFTLIELMIVIAIVGILVSVAAPQYNTYRKRSSYTEVILATVPFKVAAELAVQSGRSTNKSSLNNDSNGIPKAISAGDSVGQFVESVTMNSGTILATGTNAVDDATYTIDASLVNGGILWLIDESDANSCQKIGVC
ncbi:MAG: prepilin-type N-terminal cleavage/methylation domain-containing protein [Granulosicoccus sp.]|nr:prepilin-type N-terminal cleavage/methylation domain-containing protein [Granulosicoccus sp.]